MAGVLMLLILLYQRQILLVSETLAKRSLAGSRIYEILACGTSIPALHWSRAGPNYKAQT
jgi:hypothetical protein